MSKFTEQIARTFAMTRNIPIAAARALVKPASEKAEEAKIAKAHAFCAEFGLNMADVVQEGVSAVQLGTWITKIEFARDACAYVGLDYGELVKADISNEEFAAKWHAAVDAKIEKDNPDIAAKRAEKRAIAAQILELKNQISASKAEAEQIRAKHKIIVANWEKCSVWGANFCRMPLAEFRALAPAELTATVKAAIDVKGHEFLAKLGIKSPAPYHKN